MLKVAVIFALITLCAAPAYAARSGDMFDDNYMTSDRPEVPSDRNRRADMFGTPQPYLRTDKDMFDNVHAPGNPGVENLFSAHIHGAPPDVPLYNWKQGQPAP